MARRDHVGAAGLRQVLSSELAHRFEETEAPTEGAGLDNQHRPVDQVTEKVVDIDEIKAHKIQIGIGDDRRGRDPIERTGEDRQTPEHRLLRWRQQVVRPLHGRPQRPMPLDAGPPTAGQEPYTIIEPFHQVCRREVARACGGQLDGERDTVEAASNLLDVVPAV
jgi:hypothetical protein